MRSQLPCPIRLDSVGKCYRIFQNPQDRFKQALRDRLYGAFGRGKPSPLYRDHWALRDVSFDVKKGEAVGVLGRNGAGKSTLLQVIAGTLNTTTGQVQTSGRITALLELGSGFNPEFTGRENVFLNAQILGLSREDVHERFNDIANFADIGGFIDQPIKTYSSGMLMRLAFAVQTALDPDVLIVDEALSVGDAKFQEKCFRKLQRLRDQGTTILFVSHDVNSVASFCDRALLLEAGQLIASGAPPDIAKRYIELLYGDQKKSGNSTKQNDENSSSAVSNAAVPIEKAIGAADCAPEQLEYRFGNGNVEILSVGIFDRAGIRTEVLVSGQPYLITQRVVANCTISNLSSGFIIRDKRGVDLFGITNKTAKVDMPVVSMGTVFEVTIAIDMWLSAGDYFLQAANAGEDGVQYDCRIDAIHFTVIETSQLFTTSVVNLNPKLTVTVFDKVDQDAGKVMHG